jgi:hypothetical protein
MKAFPTTKPLDSWGDPNSGMDLRDYFAAKAMGLAYQFWLKDNYDFGFDDPTEREGLHSNMMLIAETAYEMADAMMKAREQ